MPFGKTGIVVQHKPLYEIKKSTTNHRNCYCIVILGLKDDTKLRQRNSISLFFPILLDWLSLQKILIKLTPFYQKPSKKVRKHLNILKMIQGVLSSYRSTFITLIPNESFVSNQNFTDEYNESTLNKYGCKNNLDLTIKINGDSAFSCSLTQTMDFIVSC